jgi:hypothetical protein
MLATTAKFLWRSTNFLSRAPLVILRALLPTIIQLVIAVLFLWIVWRTAQNWVFGASGVVTTIVKSANDTYHRALAVEGAALNHVRTAGMRIYDAMKGIPESTS